MSKHVALPTSRLICFGSAKACTNAGGGSQNEELSPVIRYDPT
jgi:hypothetical protein